MLAVAWVAAPPVQATGEFPSIDGPLRTGSSSPRDAAVVIGIADYANLPDVPYAAEDARAFRDFLVTTRGIPEERVALLHGGDREEILRALVHAGLETDGEGLVWVYFAGHGATSPARGERLLLGSGVERDLARWETQGISLSEVQWAATAGGARLLMVLDTAFTGASWSGPAAGGASDPPHGGLRADDGPLEGEVAVWCGAGADQLRGALHAAHHGLFTYFVLGGLRGWADGAGGGERDGLVTLREARDYVDAVVPEFPSSTQRPVLRLGSAVAPGGAASWVLGPLALEQGPDVARLWEVARRPVGGGAGISAAPVLGGGPGDLLRAHGYELVAYRPGEIAASTAGRGPEAAGHALSEVQRSTVVDHTFWVGTTEVTQSLYEAVMGTNPSFFEGDRRPVERASWYDAVEFCNRLSLFEGLEPAYEIDGEEVRWDPDASGYRLLTDAEWEAAATAGSPTLFAGSDELPAVGWYFGNADHESHEVGTKAPNTLGLYDMSGNVWEWVWDRYEDHRDDVERDAGLVEAGGGDAVADPEPPASARVLRGGSWLSIPRHVAVFRRGGDAPIARGINLGFRIGRNDDTEVARVDDTVSGGHDTSRPGSRATD